MVGDVATLILAWDATRYGISLNGAAFVNGANVPVTPDLSAVANLQIGYSSSDSGFGSAGQIDSDVLWTAMGTGTLTNSDASTINAFGSTDPTSSSFPSTASLTAIWSADTSSYQSGTFTRDTSTTYLSSSGAAKLYAPATADFTQSVNVGDTNTYTFDAYAYTDGSAVSASDLSLYYNGATISTTYTSVGSGWYKLTGSLTGADASRTYGVQVASGKTVYVDDFTLYKAGTYSVYNTTAYFNAFLSAWSSFTATATATGNSAVTYQICTDDGSACSYSSGSRWQYYTGGSWTNATDATSTYTNTASDLTTTAMAALSTTSKKISVKALFAFGGSSTPALTSLAIGLTTAGIDLDSPAGDDYTNEDRPTFRWKGIANLSKYTLTVDNPSVGSNEPSGDFSIDSIPVSGTTDIETNKYVVHFDGFEDSDSTNNYISIRTKSSSEWSSSDNDGKLREGKVSWKVKAVDSAGNETSSSRTLFVDRTDPNVEVTQINSIPFTSNIFSTTDKTPTIFGKITDSLSGEDSGQSQNDDGPKVASGPKEVNIKVEKKTGLTYKLVTLYKINMDNPYYTCESAKTIDNTKQKCDKYLPFEYTSKENLELGTYKITLTGKDKADNQSSETTLTLNITTFAQITNPEEKRIIDEKTKELKPEEKQKVEEGLEITKPTEQVPTSALERAGENIAQTAGVILSGAKDLVVNVLTFLRNSSAFALRMTSKGLAFVFDKAGDGLAYVFDRTVEDIAFRWNMTGQGLAFVFDKTGQGLVSASSVIASGSEAISNTGKIATSAIGNGLLAMTNNIGQGYSNLANNAPGMTKNIMLAVGNGVTTVGTTISRASLQLSQNVDNGFSVVGITSHNIADATGKTIGTISNNIGSGVTAFGNGAGATTNAVGIATDNTARAITRATTNVTDQTSRSARRITDTTKNGIANLAFAVGEKTDNVSHGLGTTIIKVGYLFVPEPTKINDVQVIVLSPTTAKVSWKTNHPANGKVNYGLDESYRLDVQSEKRVTSHEFTLTNLEPDTQYYFEVMSQNRNYVYDANRKFRTLR